MDCVRFVGLVNTLFLIMQSCCYAREAKTRQAGIPWVGELMEEGWIAAEESEGGDGDSEDLLPVCDGLSGDKSNRRARNCVLEERCGL